MERLSHEAPPSTANLAETYEQGYYALVELAGRFTARLATNYRNEQPRTPEHIGKQEELYAMLFSILEFARE